MDLSTELARHLREVFYGGNFSASSFSLALEDVDLQLAIKRAAPDVNSIGSLVFHTGYYFQAMEDVLAGKPISIHDKFSFDHPDWKTGEEWQAFKKSFFERANRNISALESLPPAKWADNFDDEKYGNWFRNIFGLIEHFHYHLGQIVLQKKLLQ